MLHVTNGDSVSGTLAGTSLGGETLAWTEVLQEGPVPPLPPRELNDVRAAFLSECGWGGTDELRSGLDERDDTLRRALEERRHVVLWFEHDLYDQLLLAQILAQLHGRDDGRAELVYVGPEDVRPGFRGLGELDPDELVALWPLRVPLTREVVEAGAAAWDALREPTPEAVAAVAERECALRFLPDAFRRLLEELPDAHTGLGRSERQLLEALADGPRAPLDAMLWSWSREEAPFEGDTWTLRRLDALAAGWSPLVARDATVALTDAGRTVLAGEADAVELRGIDRWIGGTHLREGRVWRWDAESRNLRPPVQFPR